MRTCGTYVIRTGSNNKNGGGYLVYIKTCLLSLFVCHVKSQLTREVNCVMSISDVFLPHPHLGDRQSSSKVDSRQKRVLIMDRKNIKIHLKIVFMLHT